MANRAYSFDRTDEDISYNPPTQHQPYRPPPQGYTVSNPSSFLPDSSRHRSQSPQSEGSSPPQYNYARKPVSQPYQEEQQYERGGYGIPMQETGQGRMSAYRRQREEEAGRQQPSPPRSRAPPAAGGAHLGLDGQSHSIPTPPQNAYSRGAPPARQQPQDRYTDRSPSQDRNAYHGAGYPSTTSERHDPFNDPFSTPRQSKQNLPATGAAAGAAAYGGYPDASRTSPDRLRNSPYADNPSANFRNRDQYGDIDPTGIDDEDDDPFTTLHGKHDKRRAAGAGGAAAGAATAANFLGNLNPGRDASGQYGAVPGGDNGTGKGERSEWLKSQTTGNKRLKWLVFGLIGLVIVLAIVGGIIGVVVSRSKSGSSSGSSDSDAADSGAPLNKNSAAIKKLMNNPNLHKVFPGMDYTPLNTIYPACLTDPPNQNHITQDIAVLSQLSPVLRLYGTDCNVTQMVIASIEALELKDSMKLWAGVYVGNNQTTNTRQINQWWSILDKYGPSYFEGVIIGNEVIFEGGLTQSQLITLLGTARTKLAAAGASGLKLATSSLGSEWTAPLAEAVDIVMSNIHPLFGGVAAAQGASWTWNYWQETDVPLKPESGAQTIAETGWPSGGGNYCTTPNGAQITCASSTSGAIAGIDEMNTFIEGWVCPALKNGTSYFWFEAVDEPWKVQFNKPGMAFEDKWGLFTAERELKPGLKIPDCGGMEAKLPSR